MGSFFGCYLLRSCSEKRGSKGRTYIGFTTNPARRLRQHNGELKNGGVREQLRMGLMSFRRAGRNMFSWTCHSSCLLFSLSIG
mmetsp:Transcript_11992/g.36544  ORF Transcript_11992/g.36544 Transcript_11992/m.36544 type:complete len:83 (-) Transcript_11992:880-1128(-)